MGADFSIELIYIETYAPQFIGHNKIFLGRLREDLFFWSKVFHNCLGACAEIPGASKASKFCCNWTDLRGLLRHPYLYKLAEQSFSLNLLLYHLYSELDCLQTDLPFNPDFNCDLPHGSVVESLKFSTGDGWVECSLSLSKDRYFQDSSWSTTQMVLHSFYHPQYQDVPGIFFNPFTLWFKYLTRAMNWFCSNVSHCIVFCCISLSRLEV